MQIHDRIFSDKYLETKAVGFDVLKVKDIEKKLEIVRDWQAGISSKRILNAKEEELQSAFLYRFFGDILGYVYAKGAKQWHLDVEQKTLADSSRMDGALGFFSLDENGKTLSDIRVVIELKNARSDLDKPQNRKNDRRTPVQQAFDYAHSVGGTCRWVIVSNFVEIRFYYQNDRSRYESFDIRNLDKTETFRRFLFLLQKDRLLSQSGESYTDKLYRERQEQEEKISKAFYNDYKDARIKLFHHLREQNSGIDELTMLNKTQKILDRVLFVCFCEDLNILPPYTFRNLLKSVKADKFNRDETKIYARVRGLFDAINSGYPEENINRFNGGLFAADELLDKLLVKDEVFEQVIGLERYDFASDLNVNILGHIFEQSVSDIEALKAGIAGKSFDRRQGKRKKEGIFYTPEYITRYIVEQAVGGWLADRKAEIGFDSLPELTEADYAASKIVRSKLKVNENVQKHIQATEAYRDRLANIRVLDPACGSGAFLNQVFDYLYKEGQKVNDELARLRAGQREIYDLDKAILTGNIFGVDLNPESAEITKLSLWLKTANRNKELTTLDNNIKCGNSLIDDPAVAGDRAFDWHKEFPEIMADGGFDVVIGNPPYVNISKLDKSLIQKLEKTYPEIHTGYNDLMYYFIYKSINLLNSTGFYSLITSNYFLGNSYAKALRKFLAHYISEIINFREHQIFEDANVHTSIIIGRKSALSKNVRYHVLNTSGINSVEIESDFTSFTLKRESLTDNWIIADLTNHQIIEKLNKNSDILGHISTIEKGPTSGNNSIFTVSARFADDKRFEQELLRKNIKNSLLNRYYISDSNDYLIYTDKNTELSTYPNIEKYLTEYKEILSNRNEVKKGSYVWYRLERPRKKEIFDAAEKLLVPYRAANNRFAYDNSQLFNDGGDVRAIVINDKSEWNIKFVLALLNSKLLDWYYQFIGKPKGKIREYFNQPLSLMPVKRISREAQQPFIEKADIMLSQNKVLHEIKSDFLNFLQSELKPKKVSKNLENWYESDWDGFRKELAKCGVKTSDLSLKARKEWQDYFVERKAQAQKIKTLIDETDREIDRMVYALYDLTEDEIRIVNQNCR